jgi:putative membrane protein
MPLSAQILALVAAAAHVLFFYLESVVWSKPSTWKTFGIESQEAADQIKPMALNQGFYNLFLAAGIVVGFVLIRVGDPGDAMTTYAPLATNPVAFPSDYVNAVWGEAFITLSLACMLGAALVLLISSRGRLARGAAIQGLIPAIALVITAVA